MFFKKSFTVIFHWLFIFSFCELKKPLFPANWSNQDILRLCSLPTNQHLYYMYRLYSTFMICTHYCTYYTAPLWYVPNIQHLYHMYPKYSMFMICTQYTAPLSYVPTIQHLYHMYPLYSTFIICDCEILGFYCTCMSKSEKPSTQPGCVGCGTRVSGGKGTSTRLQLRPWSEDRYRRLLVQSVTIIYNNPQSPICSLLLFIR